MRSDLRTTSSSRHCKSQPEQHRTTIQRSSISWTQRTANWSPSLTRPIMRRRRPAAVFFKGFRNNARGCSSWDSRPLQHIPMNGKRAGSLGYLRTPGFCQIPPIGFRRDGLPRFRTDRASLNLRRHRIQPRLRSRVGFVQLLRNLFAAGMRRQECLHGIRIEFAARHLQPLRSEFGLLKNLTRNGNGRFHQRSLTEVIPRG